MSKLKAYRKEPTVDTVLDERIRAAMEKRSEKCVAMLRSTRSSSRWPIKNRGLSLNSSYRTLSSISPNDS